MVADYISYFRNLAISHKDLQHNPDSETGDGPIGSMHFTKISPDQVLKALRAGIGFPCMTLELYDNELQSQNVADIKQLPKGSFMIVDNPASSFSADEEAVFVKTEKIVYDILKQIWQDHYGISADECNSPFKFFDYNNITITPVSKIFSGQSGYRVVFDFELQNTYDITEASEPGTFL